MATVALVCVAVVVIVSVIGMLLGQVWLAVVAFLPPVVVGAFLVAVCFSMEFRLPPTEPLRARSLLIARATWLARFFWSAVMLVVGGFVAAFVATDLIGLEQLSPAESTRRLGDSFGQWISGAVIVTVLVLTYGTSIRILIDLLSARRPARESALNQTLGAAADAEGRFEPAPSRRAWAFHLSHWAYASAGMLFAFPLVVTIAVILASLVADEVGRAIASFVQDVELRGGP
jgi:hypothetical protein